MKKKVQNRKSPRLKTSDYTNPYWYFITICTKDHKNFFGEIIDSKMIQNELGARLEFEWLKTEELRENVDLDYYQIMPNHFHGIIILQSVGTRRGVSLQMERDFGHILPNSLSIIVNQLKGSVKRWANKNGFNSFQWQRSFYDRIIRNEEELFQIRKYIEQNPLKWGIEKNIPNKLEY